ncbi:MAG: chorismate synthase [Candidatus Omnitrophica bacterium]|nr:chorismate synthase [Candidatus Omnitrophota bacterium]MBU4148736.1 chorismate synthase [Candidatus Omnitrophota bacterium]
MLRILTAGESHGEALVGILEGMPAGVKIDNDFVNKELQRRQEGYGRGDRMKIEKDTARILSGLIKGVTIGSPLSILIENKDFSMDKLPDIKNPRPGHADLAGILKYGFDNARPVLERASARESAARVAIGAVAKLLLSEFNMRILSHVVMIGGVEAHTASLSFDEIEKNLSDSRLNCADRASEKLMIEEIDNAREKKDTLGGIFEVIVEGVPAGLGSYVQYDRRLDAEIARVIMSIPAVKAVEIGNGCESARKLGSKVHDEILYSKSKGMYRKTNNAGGIEGGMSNGEDIIARGYMKPISTLMKGLNTVDIDTKEAVKSATERSDICSVPAAGVIGEAMVAFVLGNVLLEKFGGDNISDIKKNYEAYLRRLKV